MTADFKGIVRGVFLGVLSAYLLACFARGESPWPVKPQPGPLVAWDQGLANGAPAYFNMVIYDELGMWMEQFKDADACVGTDCRHRLHAAPAGEFRLWVQACNTQLTCSEWVRLGDSSPVPDDLKHAPANPKLPVRPTLRPWGRQQHVALTHEPPPRDAGFPAARATQPRFLRPAPLTPPALHNAIIS